MPGHAALAWTRTAEVPARAGLASDVDLREIVKKVVEAFQKLPHPELIKLLAAEMGSKARKAVIQPLTKLITKTTPSTSSSPDPPPADSNCQSFILAVRKFPGVGPRKNVQVTKCSAAVARAPSVTYSSKQLDAISTALIFSLQGNKDNIPTEWPDADPLYHWDRNLGLVGAQNRMVSRRHTHRSISMCHPALSALSFLQTAICSILRISTRS